MEFNTIFNEFPIIETENLILRDIREEDAEDLYAYYSDKQVSKYLDWYGPKSVDHAKEIISKWRDGYVEGWIIRWAIISKKENKIIGTIFYGDLISNARADIGYELSRKHWRQGVMTEVLKSILPIGFEKIGFQRIQAIVRPENPASQELLKKHEFKEEGLLRQYEYNEVEKNLNDMIIFSLLKDEYIEKRGI